MRDKNGRLVVDLSADDFAVAEDGVAQQVDSFTRVTRGGGIGVNVAWRSPDQTIAVSPTGERGTVATTSAADEESTTALVFGHLSSESLGLAQRATLDYIPASGESTARVGVFATDPGIRAVQGYTTDRRLVRQAVARVIPSGTNEEERTANRTDELYARRRTLQGEGAYAGGSTSAGGGTALAATAGEIGRREAELKMLQQELNLIRSFEQIDRDYKGYDVSQGLQAVVESLAPFPGRKTIVFFSEGLPVSPAMSARLDYLIEAANRANVTAYAVDANGLRAKSTTNNLRKEIDVFSEERMLQNATGVVRTEQPLTMSFERVEDMLQLDSRAGLARLSADTGGFLIEGSNNLGAAFKRIDEDSQFHYLLTYSPKKAAFDGKFRAIQVSVRRPGVQVFARKGYRAVQLAAVDRHVELRPTGAGAARSHAPPERIPDLRLRFQLSRCRAPGADTRAGPRRHRVAALRRRCAANRVFGSGGGRRPHPRRAGTRSTEAEPAIPAERGHEGSRGGEAWRDPVLSRAGPGSRHLHDGIDRLRHRRATGQRARRHADRAESGAGERWK